MLYYDMIQNSNHFPFWINDKKGQFYYQMQTANHRSRHCLLNFVTLTLNLWLHFTYNTNYDIIDIKIHCSTHFTVDICMYHCVSHASFD